MVKRPFSFSIQSIRLGKSISEGNPEDVIHELVHILRQGKADKAVQKLAADWIEAIGLKPGDKKALRKGKKELLDDWLDISEMFQSLQRDGVKRAEALFETAKQFRCSEKHVENCAAAMNRILDEESNRP